MNQNKPKNGDIHAQGFFGPEPMTVLTDVLLAAAAVFGGVKIYGVSSAPVHFYFALSFFLIALGALTGATIHAIRHTPSYPGCLSCGASRGSPWEPP